MTERVTGIADIGSDQPDLDASTERYATRFQGPAGEWLLSCQTRALLSLIVEKPSEVNVLDVGGGHGQVAVPLVERGFDVTVLATSEKALGKLNDNNQEGLTKQIGRLLPLPFPDQSFDIVTSFRIAAHIGDWHSLVAELTRVSRKAVIIDFPIPGGSNALGPFLFGLKKHMEGDTRRYTAMSRSDVVGCFLKNGFEYREHIGQFVLPMVLHRILKRPQLSATFESVLNGIGLSSKIGQPVILRADRKLT